MKIFMMRVLVMALCLSLMLKFACADCFKLTKDQLAPFQAEEWVGYTPILNKGNGDADRQTLIMIVMQKDKQNTLCIIEKQPNGTWTITGKNTGLLRNGDMGDIDYWPASPLQPTLMPPEGRSAFCAVSYDQPTGIEKEISSFSMAWNGAEWIVIGCSFFIHEGMCTAGMYRNADDQIDLPYTVWLRLADGTAYRAPTAARPGLPLENATADGLYDILNEAYPENETPAGAEQIK